MLAWLRKRLRSGRRRNRDTPRAILPTYVSEAEITLSKSSPTIRNAYEIRLALFFAVKDQKRFVLSVPPGAVVEPTVGSLIQQHGGVIREQARPHFSVFVGHIKANGEEGDGWVLGDEAQWQRLIAGAPQPIRELLSPGRVVRADELASIEAAVLQWKTEETNVDDEPINQAVLSLVREARRSGGELFVQ